jgi:hypothetical protein
MEQVRTNGAALAMMAAAGLVAAACGKKGDRAAPAETAESSIVYCAGVNSCAGQSVRPTEKYGCAGRNACKGRGIVKVTAKECKSKGGSTVEATAFEDRRPKTVDHE